MLRFCRNGKLVERSTGEREEKRARARAELMALDGGLTRKRSRGRPDESRFVYFLAAPLLGLIKIGHAEDVSKRVANIQAVSPVKLLLLGSIHGGPKKESELHGRFVDLRAHGEWFRADESLLAFIRTEVGLRPIPILCALESPTDKVNLDGSAAE